MAAKKVKDITIIKAILLIAPFIVAIVFNNLELFTIPIKVSQIKKSQRGQLDSTSKREFHRKLLKQGIYVPVEDLYTPDNNREIFPMQDASSQGKIYAWIPIKIRIPILGAKVIEWQTSFP